MWQIVAGGGRAYFEVAVFFRILSTKYKAYTCGAGGGCIVDNIIVATAIFYIEIYIDEVDLSVARCLIGSVFTGPVT